MDEANIVFDNCGFFLSCFRMEDLPQPLLIWRKWHVVESLQEETNLLLASGRQRRSSREQWWSLSPAGQQRMGCERRTRRGGSCSSRRGRASEWWYFLQEATPELLQRFKVSLEGKVTVWGWFPQTEIGILTPSGREWVCDLSCLSWTPDGPVGNAARSSGSAFRPTCL